MLSADSLNSEIFRRKNVITVTLCWTDWVILDKREERGKQQPKGKLSIKEKEKEKEP